MDFFQCPYLGDRVELSDQREQHIRNRHSDLLSSHRELIPLTLLDPDRVQISPSDEAVRLFTRWHDSLSNYVIVAVVIEAGPRYWIITARIGRRLATGEAEWIRP